MSAVAKGRERYQRFHSENKIFGEPAARFFRVEVRRVVHTFITIVGPLC